MCVSLPEKQISCCFKLMDSMVLRMKLDALFIYSALGLAILNKEIVLL